MKRILIVIGLNAAAGTIVLALLLGIVGISAMLKGFDRADTRKDKKADSISVDKSSLKNREKRDEAVKDLQKRYYALKQGNPSLYLKIPEPVFVRSIANYYFAPSESGHDDVVLEKSQVEEFRKNGIILYSMDKKYPFMKKSIYLDPASRNAPKPRIPQGTNVIIIFVESLSSFFMREDVHGVKGLTPNISDMKSRSYSFEKMYNASFPTLKGLIAALGSCIYLLEEKNLGGSRIPVPCRFLFLSDIVKAMGYSTVHVQAGSERFIGMKDFFTKKQSYDLFVGSESLLMGDMKLKQGFGVDDTRVFGFVVDWLKKNGGLKPFLLTVSTINMHPPFKVTDTLDAAGGNTLLNSVYSTDRAFGIFWDYFKKSPLKNNTVVILTADHSMGNNKDYANFAGKYREYYSPYFDFIPCLVYMPDGQQAGGVNEQPCSNLDLLPTLLDMMGIDIPNPFMGHTIFSEKKRYVGMFPIPDRKQKESANKGFSFSLKEINKARKLLNFYHTIYKQDRIVPPDYKVEIRK